MKQEKTVTQTAYRCVTPLIQHVSAALSQVRCQEQTFLHTANLTGGIIFVVFWFVAPGSSVHGQRVSNKFAPFISGLATCSPETFAVTYETTRCQRPSTPQTKFLTSGIISNIMCQQGTSASGREFWLLQRSRHFKTRQVFHDIITYVYGNSSSYVLKLV